MVHRGSKAQIIEIKRKVRGLAKKLGTTQTITPGQVHKRLKIYNIRTVNQSLNELHQQGVLIKRGTMNGHTYSLNPRPPYEGNL